LLPFVDESKAEQKLIISHFALFILTSLSFIAESDVVCKQTKSPFCGGIPFLRCFASLLLFFSQTLTPTSPLLFSLFLMGEVVTKVYYFYIFLLYVFFLLSCVKSFGGGRKKIKIKK